MDGWMDRQKDRKTDGRTAPNTKSPILFAVGDKNLLKVREKFYKTIRIERSSIIVKTVFGAFQFKELKFASLQNETMGGG
jgi:hypothetical protein